MIQLRDTFFIVSGFPNVQSKDFDKESFARLFKEKNSIITAQSSAVEYDKHWGALSIKFAWNGVENYHTHHTSYAVDQNNFLILNQDTIYGSSISSDRVVESFTLSFHPAFVDECFSSMTLTAEDNLDTSPLISCQSGRFHFAERTYKMDERIYATMMRMYSLSQEIYLPAETIDELFYEFFGLMVAVNLEVFQQVKTVRKIRASTRAEIFRRLEYARDFIEYGYSRPLDLHQIAGVACMNTEYFIRQFKALYGCSPIQYLIRKRLMEAKKMLNSMDMSVQEVCRSVGYEDPSSFGKLFRKYFKVNPKSYQLQEVDAMGHM